MCYQINKNYIAANFCENKSKPEMKCNGHCYLKKQLQANDENQSKLPFNLKAIQEIIFFISHSEIIIPKQNILFDLYFTNQEHSNYPSPLFGIFHPPKTV